MVQPLIALKDMERMSSKQFKKALKQGRRDYTGVLFTEPVKIHAKKKKRKAKDWSFRGAIFKDTVTIDGLRIGVISFESAVLQNGGIIRRCDIEEGNFQSISVLRRTFILSPSIVRWNLFISFTQGTMQKLVRSDDDRIKAMLKGIEWNEDVKTYHPDVAVRLRT